MDIEQITEVLTYANSNDRAVRLVLEDGSEVVGVPSNVDLNVDAHEVFLKPSGDDLTEIGVSIGSITQAELV